MILVSQGDIWAGTANSLSQAVKLSEKLWADGQGQSLLAMHDDDDDTTPTVSRVQMTVNGTAIVPIKGMLVHQDLPEFIQDFFGLTCYPTLQRQFAQLASDVNVKRVLLDVNSGGGHVLGLEDTWHALRELNAAKPVYTFAGDMMCSAAYWLGSTAKRVFAGEGCEVGSIGVIAAHMSYVKALQNEGIEPTVLRSGDEKCLGHELEVLGQEAKDAMQKALDFKHERFMTAITHNRQMSLAQVQTLATGRVFYGIEALNEHLIDVQSTFNQCLAQIEQETLQGVSSSLSYSFSMGASNMTLEEAQAKITQQDILLAEKDGQIGALTAQLEASRASGEAQAVALAKAQKVEQAHSQLLDDSIHTMAVALGVEVIIPDNLADKQAYHAKLSEKFQAKFPQGGVASVAQNTAQDTVQTMPAWLNKVVKG